VAGVLAAGSLSTMGDGDSSVAVPSAGPGSVAAALGAAAGTTTAPPLGFGAPLAPDRDRDRASDFGAAVSAAAAGPGAVAPLARCRGGRAAAEPVTREPVTRDTTGGAHPAHAQRSGQHPPVDRPHAPGRTGSGESGG